MVQYQNIYRNLPLYRKGVQKSWEDLCITETLISIRYRKMVVLHEISEEIAFRSNIQLLWLAFLYLS